MFYLVNTIQQNPTDQQIIFYCMSHPSYESIWNSKSIEEQYASWDRDILPILKSIPSVPKPSKAYFSTFTHNPKSCSKSEWYTLLKGALSQSVHQFHSATIEHIDTNIHCHAVLTSRYNLSKDRYRRMSAHRLQFKRIKYDNGINEYNDKENPLFTDLSKFIEYYDSILKE